MFGKTTTVTVDPVIEAAVQRVQGGDQDAWLLVFDRFHDPLTRWAERRSAGNTVTAQDIVQDTWLAALKGIASYETRAGKGFGAWLFTLAGNVACNHGRKASHRREVASDLGDWDMAAAGSVEDDVTNGMVNADLLRAALTTLTDKQRRLLTLHADGFTFIEIGQILGMTQGAAKTAHCRAMAAVRAHLPAVLSNPSGARAVVTPRHDTTMTMQQEVIGGGATRAAASN